MSAVICIRYLSLKIEAFRKWEGSDSFMVNIRQERQRINRYHKAIREMAGQACCVPSAPNRIMSAVKRLQVGTSAAIHNDRRTAVFVF